MYFTDSEKSVKLRSVNARGIPMRRLCGHAGCGLVVKDVAYCVKHQPVRKDKPRPNRNVTFMPGWHKIRKEYLMKHPLCSRCAQFNITTIANQVDHITPHRGDHTLFYNQSNFMALCQSCHSHKTAMYDGGFGHKR